MEMRQLRSFIETILLAVLVPFLLPSCDSSSGNKDSGYTSQNKCGSEAGDMVDAECEDSMVMYQDSIPDFIPSEVEIAYRDSLYHVSDRYLEYDKYIEAGETVGIISWWKYTPLLSEGTRLTWVLGIIIGLFLLIISIKFLKKNAYIYGSILYFSILWTIFCYAKLCALVDFAGVLLIIYFSGIFLAFSTYIILFVALLFKSTRSSAKRLLKNLIIPALTAIFLPFPLILLQYVIALIAIILRQFIYYIQYLIE